MDRGSHGSVIAFNEAINRRDLQALAGLMTDDHSFVDSASVCSTEPALDGPAIWTAETHDGKVSEWRVHEDTPANRQRLGI